ncbi:MAG: polysaccharide biosynthesis protein [Chlorobi bacterium]|nr:polysaccharide biosynthesis protein [Chlorobiota bacterium]
MFLKRNTPRWIIFTIDVGICFVSISLAYLLRFNFRIPYNVYSSLVFVIPFVLFVRALSFIISRTYAGIVRYTGTKDAERIFIVVLSGTAFFIVADFINYFFIGETFIIPHSIIVIDFLATVFAMTAMRLLVKTLFLEFNNPKLRKTNIIIYGTDQFGITTKRTLDQDMFTNYNVVAFIEDTNQKAHKKLEGVTIYDTKELERILKKHKIEHLIISKDAVSSSTKNELIEICLDYDVQVLTVPPIKEWINGELSFNQIKQVKIEELLERDPIVLDKNKIRQDVLNQVVLVTGAAGSIGSEIVKQLKRFNPKKIILFDQAESPLYDIELDLQEGHNFTNFEVVIGDVTNEERVNNVFETYQPSLVYHAAAYKHVPMMENNPTEAIRANVLGTKLMADLSTKHMVKKFVMVSTDKAVNPTNIMGASKRLAEIYIQSLNRISKTNFITTRFGNVLGSNGSVIPRFKKQIENGGPVTVTHPEVTRYFMTIPEACQLVLEACAMGKGGEIFIFDMGNSVKIVDLAKKMIRLSGLTLGKDIQLNFTGLRPGEKLYEELLNDKENTLPTHHSQIMIARIYEYDYSYVTNNIDRLIQLINIQDNFQLVKLMKEIVPEFKSKNSIYEQLDLM